MAVVDDLEEQLIEEEDELFQHRLFILGILLVRLVTSSMHASALR